MAWKAVLLLLGLLVPAALAADCTTNLTGTAGSVICTGNVPKDINDPPQSWDAALAPLANATAVKVEFRDVRPFSAVSFTRALDIVLGVGASGFTGSVDVLLTNCSMKGAELDYAAVAALAGTKSYSVRVQDSEFIGNQMNVTGAFAAESDFSLSMQVTGTSINRNKLMAFGLAAVGAAGTASISVTEGSEVERNEVYLLGALAVGGGASLSIQLASSNITRNDLYQMGLVAVGGQASASVTGADEPGVTVEGNSQESKVQVVAQQPLVASVLEVVMGLGFNQSSFDLGAALTQAQGEICSLLAGLNASAASTPADELATMQALASQVTGLLCANGTANPSVNMSALVPLVEGWLGQGLGGLSSVLDGLLTDSGLLESLVAAIEGDEPLGTALDDVLQSLLSNQDVQSGAAVLGDLLSQLGQWLDKPLGDGSTASGSGLDLPGTIQDIIGAVGGGLGGGEGGEGEGGEGGDVAAGLTGSLADIVQQVLGSITGEGGEGGGEDGDGGDGGGTTPGDLINSIVGALTGGADSPLAGQDVSSLVPVLGAILQDPDAVASLPGLLSGVLGGGGGGEEGDGQAGGLDLAGLGPILSAVTGNEQASAALPDVLGLLGSLGLGGLGGDSGN